jgi:hypothetical protein
MPGKPGEQAMEKSRDNQKTRPHFRTPPWMSPPRIPDCTPSDRRSNANQAVFGSFPRASRGVMIRSFTSNRPFNNT